ncbi:MAG: class I SAM-dependent methyltransferase [Clostridia bacterium]|nr:class I SAM-dependent methyltransferase [Clostridia bacterium]
MDKKEVVEFFDSVADSWDDCMIKEQWKIDKIFDAAGVMAGKAVLDVACGTGVLVPDYIARNVRKCVAVDISEKMIRIAKSKFSAHENIEFVCADAEQAEFSERFDCVMIYNAFPHFTDSEQLFENLSKCLEVGGRITVAHGMSRNDLMKHHSGSAKNFSKILPQADELAETMKPYFDVDTRISTDEIYIVSGKKIRQ